MPGSKHREKAADERTTGEEQPVKVIEYDNIPDQIEVSDVPDGYVVLKNGLKQIHIAHEDALKERKSVHYPDEGATEEDAIGVYDTLCGIQFTGSDASIHSGYTPQASDDESRFIKSHVCGNCLRSLKAATDPGESDGE